MQKLPRRRVGIALLVVDRPRGSIIWLDSGEQQSALLLRRGTQPACYRWLSRLSGAGHLCVSYGISWGYSGVLDEAAPVLICELKFLLSALPCSALRNHFCGLVLLHFSLKKRAKRPLLFFLPAVLDGTCILIVVGRIGLEIWMENGIDLVCLVENCILARTSPNNHMYSPYDIRALGSWLVTEVIAYSLLLEEYHRHQKGSFEDWIFLDALGLAWRKS